VRILLTGRNGQVGWELERALPALGEVIATDRTALDLCDLDAIRRAVRDASPQLIVNAAAYTAVDRAESEPEAAMALNARAPGILAEEAKRTGALLVHYSTDYVFDGEKRSPYVETDAPNPLGAYGRSKLAGEDAIRSSGCRHLLLRTSWVYGPRGRNFLLAIAGKAAAGEALRVVSDQTGVPTSSAFVAEMTVHALRARPEVEGLYHVVPQGEASWWEFARAIVAGLGSSIEVTPIPSEAYPLPARRPKHAVLANARFCGVFGVEPPDWRVDLARCLESAPGVRSRPA
jgi:dTDP-4-dehydrorhamnose reductase